MKLGYLILGKIFKFIATRCQILRLKCTKFNFGWGSARSRWRRLQRSPDLAGFKGPTFKKGEGQGGEWEGRGEGREGDPKIWFTLSMSEILKQTLIAELI